MSVPMVSGFMSIDKESSGVPEINVHRPATKVNLWMVVAIVLFLAAAAGAAFWRSQQTVAPTGDASTATEKK